MPIGGTREQALKAWETRRRNGTDKHSDDSRKKISKGLMGRPCSNETREKIRSSNTGKTHSLETRKKLSKLLRGKKRSDQYKENLRQKMIIHGHCANHRHSPTLRTWDAMIHRCGSPRNIGYRWYGARGISVCDRWKDFGKFLEDMGERPPGKTIDRIDNYRGYEPGNCRWATFAEQRANRRILE